MFGGTRERDNHAPVSKRVDCVLHYLGKGVIPHSSGPWAESEGLSPARQHEIVIVASQGPKANMFEKAVQCSVIGATNPGTRQSISAARVPGPS